MVYTASKQSYADAIIDHIDPSGSMIAHRLYREDCLEVQENLFVKDLRVIGGRDLRDMCLVDNALYSFYFQLPNGVPILPYYNNPKDVELLKLGAWLLRLPKDVALSTLVPAYFGHDRLATVTSLAQMKALYRPSANK